VSIEIYHVLEGKERELKSSEFHRESVASIILALLIWDMCKEKKSSICVVCQTCDFCRFYLLALGYKTSVKCLPTRCALQVAKKFCNVYLMCLGRCGVVINYAAHSNIIVKTKIKNQSCYTLELLVVSRLVCCIVSLSQRTVLLFFSI
jgi:hypothetical protein